MFLAVWWLRQSAVSPPVAKADQANASVDHSNSAVMPPAASGPPLSPKLSQVSPPRLGGPAASATSGSSAPAAASTPAVSPQAALATSFADLAHDYRSFDIKTLLEDYMTPATYAAMAPGGMEDIVQAMAVDQDAPMRFELQAEMFDSLVGQTPSYNEAGDEATYVYQAPPELTHQDFQTWHLHFTKISGRWYWADIAPQGGFDPRKP